MATANGTNRGYYDPNDPGYDRYGLSSNDPAQVGYINRANDLAASYGNELSSLAPYGSLLDQGYWQDKATRDATEQNTANVLNNTVAANQGIAGQLTGYAGAANQADQGVLSGYAGAIGQGNAMDASNVGQLQQLNSSMQQLQAGGYGADVTSDPRYVGMQQNAYDALGGYASGAHDLTSEAATATADPEALAAQKEALAAYKERIDPKMTDAERALYLQNRLQQEQSNRANRDANMRELGRRGMSGSTMQLSNLNASSQENAINRQLGDLNANKAAIERAQQSLAGYGNLSSTIADQSFRRDFSTKSAADQMAVGNRDIAFQGTQAQGNMATNMRASDDALKTFNKAQSLQQQRFQDQYRADQQAQAWGRGTDLSKAQFQQSGNLTDRAGAYANTATQSINNQYNRLGDASKTNIDVNNSALKGQQDFAAQQGRDLDSNRAALAQSGDFQMGRTKAQLAAQMDVNNTVNKAMDSAAEDRRATQAQIAAQRQQDQQNQWDQEHRSPFSLLFG